MRAVVRQWLQLGGVVIRTAPPPVTGATPIGDPRPAAADRAYGDVAAGPTPGDLPDRRAGRARTVRTGSRSPTTSGSSRWTGLDPGPLHLDQFDGEISWVFVKQAREQLTFVDVAGQDAVWFAEPHPIAYIDSAGVEHTEQARMAGPCLVWQRTVGGRLVTVRLEGQLTMDGAISIAESVS